MAFQEPVLDELQWSNQEWVQHFGGIHENTVLYYFARSPFCEATSNNSSIETQAMYNPSMAALMDTRDKFEAHLKTLQGVEYMVAMGPQDFWGEAPINQGTWVIRKQNRRKRSGAEDEVNILATYFVVGDHIYMAPSVSHVIQARLLSTIMSLKSLIRTASTLPLYTPALGHRYLLPNHKPKEIPISSTTQHSREATPLPDVQQITSLAKDPVSGAAAQLASSAQNSAVSTRALHESFSQFIRYNKEYMDENPLLGEPGSFVFSSSKQHLVAQQEQAQRDAEQAAKRAEEAAAKKVEEAAALKIKTDIKLPVTPPPVSAKPKPDRKQSSVAGGTKVKKKKLKGSTTPGPGTPVSATTPRTPA